MCTACARACAATCHLPTLQDPSLWPAAVDEICRYHTASSYALRRVALEDVKLGGTTIR